MTRNIVRVLLGGVFVCLTAAVSFAQTSTASETKQFRIIAVDGNRLIVNLPEGTRDMTVADDAKASQRGSRTSAPTTSCRRPSLRRCRRV
jgi:hypothetical protein